MAKVKLNIEIDSEEYEKIKKMYEQAKILGKSEFTSVEDFIAKVMLKVPSFDSLNIDKIKNLTEQLKNMGSFGDLFGGMDLFNDSSVEEEDKKEKIDPKKLKN